MTDRLKAALLYATNKANGERRQRPIISPFCEVEKLFSPRFLSKIRKDDVTGCWIWIGATKFPPRYPEHKYGQFFINGTQRSFISAHKHAYNVVYGPVPDGLEIDHACHVKLCVNPDHLEAVTHQQNCKWRKRSGPKPGFQFEIVDGKRRKVVA